jgi:hypothetical protein
MRDDQLHALAELAYKVNTNREARRIFRKVCEFERMVSDVARLSSGKIDWASLIKRREKPTP